MNILIPVGLGELYDKISILEIKSERIKDKEKLAYVAKELSELKAIAVQYPIDEAIYREMKEVNELIWDGVGKQWDIESEGGANEETIALARDVYTLNDKRAEVKRKINMQYGSDIVEVKEYNKKK